MFQGQTAPGRAPATIPAHAGIGLRSAHHDALLQTRPATAWLEIHPENFFADGGKPLQLLEQVRALYPLSLHGVGLSLGSTDPLNKTHLSRLKHLIDQFQPGLVSEHLSWGSAGDRYLNDLLPLPYTAEALDHMVERVSQVQDYLGRQILIENVSSYLEFSVSDIPEWEFFAALARRAGCGLLLDINNVYVNACNHGFAAADFLTQIPAEFVQEIHLAGFSVNPVEGGEILIDTHSRPVCEQVWQLYQHTIDAIGPRPTLIEWDQDLPELNVLLAEAQRAEHILERAHALAA